MKVRSVSGRPASIGLLLVVSITSVWLAAELPPNAFYSGDSGVKLIAARQRHRASHSPVRDRLAQNQWSPGALRRKLLQRPRSTRSCVAVAAVPGRFGSVHRPVWLAWRVRIAAREFRRAVATPRSNGQTGCSRCESGNRGSGWRLRRPGSVLRIRVLGTRSGNRMLDRRDGRASLRTARHSNAPDRERVAVRSRDPPAPGSALVRRRARRLADLFEASPRILRGRRGADHGSLCAVQSR